MRNALPLSKTEIDRLGDRLRVSASVSEGDLRLLQGLRADYEAALEIAQRLIADAFSDAEVSSRLKTVHTTVDKLRRESGMKLSRMQDIAGLRLVANMTLSEQDLAAQRVVSLLDGGRIVDRRASPSHGYRAVHVWAKCQERRLEVQIRTRLQDRWAQIFERLADRWGRQIRYGGLPEDPTRHDGPMSRRQVCDMVLRMSEPIAMCEEGAEPDPAAIAPQIGAKFYCREVDAVLAQLASKAAKVAGL